MACNSTSVLSMVGLNTLLGSRVHNSYLMWPIEASKQVSHQDREETVCINFTTPHLFHSHVGCSIDISLPKYINSCKICIYKYVVTCIISTPMMCWLLDVKFYYYFVVLMDLIVMHNWQKNATNIIKCPMFAEHISRIQF